MSVLRTTSWCRVGATLMTIAANTQAFASNSRAGGLKAHLRRGASLFHQRAGSGVRGGSALSSTSSSSSFGEWESPITATFITTAGVGLGSVKSGPVSGDVFWMEARPNEGGRMVICRRAPDDPGASERGAVDVTPAGSNVRTRVHEYGGGAFLVDRCPECGEEVAIYSNFADQRLYKVRTTTPKAAAEEEEGEEEEPMCLTPVSEAHPEEPAALFRFADGVVDPLRRVWIGVREDHRNGPKATGVANAVVAVALDGSGRVDVLAEGGDFYAAPRVSPDGSTLAFVTWDHPSMPWDDTRLVVVALAPPAAGDDHDGAVRTAGPEVTVAGHASSSSSSSSSSSGASVLQPSWNPVTGELHFVSDEENGFWNIMVVRGSGGGGGGGDGTSAAAGGAEAWAAATRVENLLPREGVEFSGPAPGWALGQQGYAFLPDGSVASAYAHRGKKGKDEEEDEDEFKGGSRLVVVSADGANVDEYSRRDGLPYAFGGLVVGKSGGGELYMVGTAPDKASVVAAWRGLQQGTDEDEARDAAPMMHEVLASSMKESMRVDSKYVSTPRAIEFPTADGAATAYGFFYPPQNGDYEPSTADDGAEKPPLLVKAHGGPTACTGTSFNPAIQFWTSRGFAVLDVDYRGSTGYGRPYRQALKGNWGICDIEDVCAGARHLVKEGLVDPKRLAIDGGSAGGYTTLGALAFEDVFTAGCSLYGVADLSALAGDTHKFESRYLDGLVGPYPEEADLYAERAPINAADQLSCPVLLLQGDEDKVVPPNQAETMFAALQAKGIPTALKMYEGEQHGFRKAENIQDALNSELFFYSKVWGFRPAGEIPSFDIENLAP